ncbi:unnamed protein product [Gongylonema pulchrum]|uniref:Uncharacterized protein n=1 Tax=Gongylonema pulchrum TaxID=637853 RepID=A0A183EUI1_9BILA|nr:unnamed protein product [Gongylonema pulchrum]
MSTPKRPAAANEASAHRANIERIMAFERNGSNFGISEEEKGKEHTWSRSLSILTSICSEGHPSLREFELPERLLMDARIKRRRCSELR